LLGEKSADVERGDLRQAAMAEMLEEVLEVVAIVA